MKNTLLDFRCYKKQHFKENFLHLSDGFTLIELLVVISIISLLSSVVLTAVNPIRGKARISAGQQFDANMYHAFGANMVAAWELDEGSGSTAVNSAASISNQFNGSLNAQTWVSGISRGALNFNGTGVLINTPDLQNRADLFGGVTSGKILFTAWIRRGNDLGGSGDRKIIKGLPGIWTVNIIPTTDLLKVNVGTIGGGSSVTLISDTKIRQNEWTHIGVLVEAGIGAKIYINGRLDMNFSDSSFALEPSNYDPPTGIGLSGIGDRSFKGDIDSVRVYYASI